MPRSKRELKYNQIKDMLQKEIIDRNLQPGEQILSVTEIMERFQVSKVTAVRSVLELENEGVVRRERGRGTFVAAPKPNGAALRKSVAVIVPDMSNPFYAEVVSSLERRLRESSITIELSSTDYQIEEERRHVELIIHEQQVSGIVICSFRFPHELDEQILNFPLVAVDYAPNTLVGRCNSVTSDNLQGGQLATTHLLELGHQRIGYVNIPGANQERLMGYKWALRQKGIAFDDNFVLTVGTVAPRLEHDLINYVREQRLTALFAVNDMIAAECMKMLRRAGYAIPEDISIVGYDNTNSAQYFEVPLTTIEQYEEEMGRKAADMLIDLMELPREERPRPREFVLLPRLIVRESTGPVAAHPLQKTSG